MQTQRVRSSVRIRFPDRGSSGGLARIAGAEGHAVRVVAEVRLALDLVEPALSDQSDDGGIAIGREPVLGAQLPVVGERGAYEPAERGNQEAAAPGEGEQLRGVGQRADIGWNDVGDDEMSAGLQL